MKTLILTLILALSATQAQAWYVENGIYHGKRARVFFYNPWAAGGVRVLGPRYYGNYRHRPLRGVYGGYTGRGDLPTPGDMLRSRRLAEDIATELYLQSPIR